MTSYKAGEVNKRIIALFDVDGTLTAPRKVVTPDMHAYLMSLKERITIGVVGGSDLPKQREQLGEDVTSEFNYSFSENGTTAYKAGELIGQTSIAAHLGEQLYALYVCNATRYGVHGLSIRKHSGRRRSRRFSAWAAH